jgi:DNA topoisomerase-1
VQVLNGRYGPYISDGKLNGKIPKDREPASLTLEEVTRLLQETGKPARRGFGAKKAAAKKAAPAKKTAKAPAKKAAGKTTAKKATTRRAAKKAYVSPHPEPAKPLVTPAKVIEPGKKRVVKPAKDDAPF